MDTIDEFTTTWQTEFQRGLNNVEFLSSGPLWKLCHVIVNHNHNHVKNNVDSCNIAIDVDDDIDVDVDDDIDIEKEEDNSIEDLDDKNMDQKEMETKVDKSALIFIMNHGIDDQKSINIIMKDLLFYVNYYLYNNKHYNNNNNNDHSVSVDNAYANATTIATTTLFTTSTTTTSTATTAVSIISTANINNTDNNINNNINNKIQKFDFPLSIEKAISNSSSNNNNISTTYKLILWIILQVYNSLSFPTLLPNRIKKEIQQINNNNNKNHKHKNSNNNEYILPNNRYTYCKFFNLTKMNINSLKLKLNEQRDIEYYNKLNTINHINNDTDNDDDVNDEDDDICNSSSGGSSDKYNFNRFFIKILQNYNNSRRKLSITNILSAAMLCVTTAFLQDMNHCYDCHLIDDRDDDNMLEELKLRFLLSVDLRPYGTSSTITTATRTPTVSSTSFTTSATTTSAIDIKEDNDDFTGGTVACAAGAIDFIVPITKRMSKLILPWASSSSILSSEFKDEFWQLVAQTRDSSSMIIDEFDLVPESVRLFGLGMIPDDMFLFP